MGNPWVHGKSEGNPWEMTDPRNDRHGLKVRNLQATVASILENHEIYENLSEIREIYRNLRKSTKGYKNLQGSGKGEGEGAGMEVRERGRAGTGDMYCEQEDGPDRTSLKCTPSPPYHEQGDHEQGGRGGE